MQNAGGKAFAETGRMPPRCTIPAPFLSEGRTSRGLAPNSGLNNKKKMKSFWPWLLAAAVLGALGFLFFGGLFQPSGQDGESEESAAADSHTPDNIRKLPGRQASALNSGWEVVDPASVDKLPAYKEVVPNRALVRILDAINDWEAGDQIILGIPQLGAEFDGVIERAEQDANGNRTYLGLLHELNGRSYRFVVTSGPRNTFAHIGTSRGTFELVATGGALGWLMPTSSMDQHVDYTQPDYYIVEDKRLQEDEPAP